TIKVKKEKTAFSSEKERAWIERNVMNRVTFPTGNAELTRSITFESDEYAQKQFSLNGRYLGDRFSKTVEVRGLMGAYLTVHDGGSYLTHRISPFVESNDTVNAVFSEATCSLLVTSAPAGAAISVDGFQTGFATPYVVNNISEGKHLVSVSKQGYITGEREILLTNGSGDATVEVALEPYTWGSLE
ncbi:MAG TPA: PEGA domain-containing protein, partial [Methanoregula sp.]|nr:PEGA domain-containing protein [Methanoregula sp.]